MKRKVIGFLLAATMLVSCLGMAGCGSSKEAEEEKDLLGQIQDRGSIVIATEGTWAPWTYHDEKDNLTGFDVEVGKAIAEKLGVEAEFVEVEWDGIFAGIDSGRYDIACNGVEVDEEREEKYNFTTPYAYMRTAIIVREDEDRIQSFEDLEGMKTANTLQSTYAKIAESYGAEVTGVDDLIQTIELLQSGRIDATLNAEVSYYDYMKSHPDAKLKIAALSEDASYVSIPVRKGEKNESLLAAINEAIEELAEEGVLSELSEKYFGSDITQAEVQ